MVTSLVLMAVARAILAKMEVHAPKYVSPRAFGTIFLVQKILVGRHCEFERKAARTTKLREKRKSGLYTIIDDSNQSFQVFCDFDSELRFAWNLIQSSSLSQKTGKLWVSNYNLQISDTYHSIKTRCKGKGLMGRSYNLWGKKMSIREPLFALKLCGSRHSLRFNKESIKKLTYYNSQWKKNLVPEYFQVYCILFYTFLGL